MNLKKNWGYLMGIIIILIIAFGLDIFSSHLQVELGPKKILNEQGDIITRLELIYPKWHTILNLLKNFLYGLAAAIFITVFIASKLEESQKKANIQELKDLNNSININVFDSLFKTIIPKEIFKIIKQEIIENKILRKNAQWVYTFKEVNNQILCTQTTRYELHNLSQSSVSDPVVLVLNDLAGEPYTILLAECIGIDGKKLVYYEPLGPNNININVDQGDNYIKVSYTVDIPPESHVEYNTTFQRMYTGDITDAQFTKFPVINADIVVNFPEGYLFDMVSVMSSTPKLTIHTSTQKIYKIKGGLLPKQGFIFYLKKLKNS